MHPIQLSIVLIFMALGCRHKPTPVSNGLELSLAPKGKTYNVFGDYLIDVNDLLSIHVQGNKELTGSYRVSPSGYISVPLAGMVRAKGVSELQLRDAITMKLRPHLSGPRVSVAVSEANSYVIYFSGLVQKPGTYHISSHTTLLQGLSLAGGWQDAQANRIVVIRESAEAVKKRYETTLESVRRGNSFVDNFWLERGDLIIVE